MKMPLWSMTEGEPRKRWNAAVMTVHPACGDLLPWEALGLLHIVQYTCAPVFK